MLSTLLQVAIGGAIGASARFLSGVAMTRYAGATAIPVAIMSVNIIGSFLMGVLAVVLVEKNQSTFAPFLMTGVLGGFTTFSAFSLEAVTLYETGELGFAFVYVVASVVLSLLALGMGFWLARGVFL